MHHNYTHIHTIMLLALALVVRSAIADNGDGGGGSYYIAGSPYGNGTTTSSYPESTICSNLTPQNSLDITQILGLWYVCEILIHSKQMPTVTNYDFLVHVYITDVTEQMQEAQNAMRERYYKDNFNRNSNANVNNRRYETQQSYRPPASSDVPTRYLSLMWNENDKNLEYSFNYTLSSPGIWLNTGEQRGSMALRSDYKQFHGSVEVLKAVHDHVVLTFCDTFENSSTYSVVLTRNISGLNAEDLESIRKLLDRRHLPVGDIRKVCNSSMALAPTTAMASVYCALAMALLVVRGWNVLTNGSVI